MARFISTAQRRRTAGLLAGGALVAGVAGGFSIGHWTAATVDEKVNSVQARASDTSAGLQVLATHAEQGISNEQDLKPILAQTRADLNAEFADAPWLGARTKATLLATLDALEKSDGKSPGFITQAKALTAEIDQAFGNS